MIKVIKTDAEYETAMTAIESLVALDPKADTPAYDELEVLGVLISDYERRTFSRDAVDPVEAIRFRMEQQNLTPRDLVQFIGSRSKVSEVLNGKRPLSLAMIRSLHEGLGIPASSLVGESSVQKSEEVDIPWERFPAREMAERGWFPEISPNDVARLDKSAPFIDALKSFFAPLGSPLNAYALYRKTEHIRSARAMNSFALTAWTARIMLRAQSIKAVVPYVAGTVNTEFMRDLVRLSWSDQGPELAREFLAANGILLIVEPHLSRTHLDGAALMIAGNRPVIGMTLRYDRLDNFWFVLMHELAHVALHYSSGTSEFYDDLESEDQDPRERDADALAGEVLVPQESWEGSPASRLRTPNAAQHLAKTLRIHPAIVAGRMRREFKSYRILNDLVGQGEVRKWFTNAE